MRKLLLIALLYTGFAQAQVQVSFGALTHEFGVIQRDGIRADVTQGGGGYLSVGDTYGGTILIAGDSQITYGESRVGKGMVGFRAWSDVVSNRDGFSLRFKIGANIYQVYERRNLLAGTDLESQTDNNPVTNQPELKTSFIMPAGGIEVSWKFIEIGYEPFGKTINFGFKLRR